MATKAQHASPFKNRLYFGWPVRKAFYRHLSVQSAQGIPVERALEGFLPRLRRKKNHYVATIVASVARRFRDGQTLADALHGYVPVDELAVIRSGELGGTLPDALELIITSSDRVARVQNAIRQAAFAPGIYIAATFGMVWVLGRYVIPDLQHVLPARRAQGSVAILYALGDFATSWWALLPLVLAVLLIAWLAWAMPNWTGKGRISVERFFPFSFYRDTNGFRWLMSFTSLLGSGMPDVQILDLQTQNASPWLRQRMRAFHMAMINGQSFSGALLERSHERVPYGFPNPDIVDDIASLDGFPDFHTKIQLLAREWARDLEEKTLLWASRMGFYCEMALFGIMGLLMVAINSLSSQISNVAGM